MSNISTGLERLAQYILRCPFRLSRVVRLTDDGWVVYRAQQARCRRFPGPASGDLKRGRRRNFQVFSALNFLAELTQHIPDKGEQLVRYDGWYSHRQRGIRVLKKKGNSATVIFQKLGQRFIFCDPSRATGRRSPLHRAANG